MPEPLDVDLDGVENGDKPEMDDKGNILSIEHDDGSITVSIDDRPVEMADGQNPPGWFDDISDRIGEDECTRIAEDVLRGIDDDLVSRADWVESRAEGMKLLGLKLEVPGSQGGVDGAPVEGMSKVRHPLLLEAVLRFQANARSELLPTDGPVKIRNDDNNATLAEDQLANALEKDLNHYLTSTASEYYPDTDRMLLMLGFGGTAFKKVYFCPLRNRPVSETVDADDLIVNNGTTDLENARRITHRIMMRPSVVRRMQILGAYRDIDLGEPDAQEMDSVQREKEDMEGVKDAGIVSLDRNREIYECYCELSIRDFEHKHKGKISGLDVPWRVTIDKSSRKILSIVRNFNEDTDELPVARKWFVKYSYVPGFGFYDIGLLHILGNTTNAVTAAWREMLDNGMYANFPGFLIAKGATRQNTNLTRVPPGGGAPIDTNGGDIRQAVMPLPYSAQGMPALMNLVNNMVETGQRVGGTSELQVGEGRADVPVGTTLAMIDQATKVENAVHKRLHSAQAEEFRLICGIFEEHPRSFWQRNSNPATPWDEETFLRALRDYDLCPQADPNTSSHTQRVMKVMGLKQLQAASPNLYDPLAVDTAALQALGWNNPQQFLAKPNPNGNVPPPQVMEAMAKAETDKTTANARMMDAQTKQAEAKAKIDGGFYTKDGGTPEDNSADQIQAQASLMDAETKRTEIGLKQHQAHVEDINRDKDRESEERKAAMDVMKELIGHPESLGLAGAVVDPVEKIIQDPGDA